VIFKSLHNKVAISLNIGENQVEQRSDRKFFTDCPGYTLYRFKTCLK